MRALTFDPATDQWTKRDLPTPEVDGHDVLVRVEACGLNPVDAKIAQWKGAAPDMDSTWVAGLDVSGEVVAVGPEVTAWQVGDRVLGHGNMFRPHGGLAELSVQDGRTLVPHPVGIDAATAASTPCAGWTAWRALHDRLRISARDSLLVAGGAGGVGGFALQVARDAGLTTIIATTSARNAEYVRSLGATRVVDYTREDVVARVRDVTGGLGVTRGVDTVGGENARLVADSLGFEGEMVELVDVVDATSFGRAFDLGLGFHQLSLGSGHRNGEAGRQTLTRARAAFSRALEEGRIAAPQLEVIDLDEAGAALTTMLDQRTVGKVVVQP
jgi:NADPH:quinone reductase-like Zn-dependent oxidoreductase